MVKHILVYKYHEIFLKNKEEQNVNICNNMSDSPENYAKWEKVSLKRFHTVWL